MIRSLLFALLSVCAQALVAQTVFIPDTYLRTWLNAAMPGVVDASGNCDTLMWNSAPPGLVGFSLVAVPDNGTVDLEGMQHLKIQMLTIGDLGQSNITLLWPGHPRNNAVLDLSSQQVDDITGPFFPLPDVLLHFICTSCGLTELPVFSGNEMDVRNVDLSAATLTVPPSLDRLTLQDCALTTLPDLANVEYLTISDNPLTGWPVWPPNLISLVANNVGLPTLPTLPTSVTSLYLGNNGIADVPELPATLHYLSLFNNEITVLPPLPPDLWTLNVNNNPLTVLPPLPSPLYTLEARYTGITSLPEPLPDLINLRMDGASLTSLPALPASLYTLSFDYTPVAALPPLPAGLRNLYATYATQLNCLLALPANLYNLQLEGSGVTCLPNLPTSLNLGQLDIPAVVCNAVTSPCTTVEPRITGLLFDDADENGVQDVGEGVRPFGVVSAQPGDLLAGADMNGNYVLPADIGTFTVTGAPALYETITTAPATVTLNALGEVAAGNDVGFHLTPGMVDLVCTLTATNARPGFFHQVWLQVRNVGTEAIGGTLQFTHDAVFTWGSATVPPTTQVGNVLSWTLAPLQPGDVLSVQATLYLPPSTPLGTPFQHNATATPVAADQTPVDNSSALNNIVVGSYDPNDKRVEPEFLFQQQVQNGEHVTYTVRFQNTGTFPAERVLITDTLSADLQHGTLRVSDASHEHTWWVRHGVLHVLFDGIDLPDSTSDEANSHGFVRFTIVPTADLLPGESVGNIANIYFDFNEPIITNTALFTIDITSGVQRDAKDEWRIAPNPVTDRLTLHGPQPTEGALVEVVDLTGTVVRRASFRSVPMTLDVAGLAPGIYFLRSADSGLLRRFVKG